VVLDRCLLAPLIHLLLLLLLISRHLIEVRRRGDLLVGAAEGRPGLSVAVKHGSDGDVNRSHGGMARGDQGSDGENMAGG